MHLGMIGLGRMTDEIAIGASSLADMAKKLDKPRIPGDQLRPSGNSLRQAVGITRS